MARVKGTFVYTTDMLVAWTGTFFLTLRVSPRGLGDGPVCKVLACALEVLDPHEKPDMVVPCSSPRALWGDGRQRQEHPWKLWDQLAMYTAVVCLLTCVLWHTHTHTHCPQVSYSKQLNFLRVRG